MRASTTATVRRAGSRLWRAADRVAGGHLHASAWGARSAPALAVYSVYRRRNAPGVKALLSALPPGSSVALHALDEVAVELADVTSGVGGGARVPLLGALIDLAPPRSDQLVALVDDDVAFVTGGLQSFSRIAAAGALDLAMPAHVPGSNWTFRVTVQRPFSTVRRTRFVEVGPILLMSPRAFARAHPFPPDARMGWGLDVLWSTYARDGMRLGVVDATPVRHLGEVASSYDVGEERSLLDRYSEQAGVSSAYDLAEDTGEVWRPWQRTAPWVAAAPSAGTGP